MTDKAHDAHVIYPRYTLKMAFKPFVCFKVVCLFKVHFVVLQDVNVGTSARELFNIHINNLSSATCQQLVLKTMCKIDEMLRDSLRPKVDYGLTRAVCTANATVDKWGSKVRFTASCAVLLSMDDVLSKIKNKL